MIVYVIVSTVIFMGLAIAWNKDSVLNLFLKIGFSIAALLGCFLSYQAIDKTTYEYGEEQVKRLHLCEEALRDMILSEYKCRVGKEVILK